MRRSDRREWALVDHLDQFMARKSTSQDLQLQVLLVAQPIRPALKDANLVVQSFDETEGDLVLAPAVGGQSVPMPLGHLRGGLASVS
jgi:hypothetical protein